MFTTTTGIVLRTYPFKDNRIISKVFTKNHGLVSCIARKQKSQIILSQPLTIVQLTYRQKKTNTLIHVHDVSVEHVYKTLTINNAKIQCALLLCEILNNCLKEINESAYIFMVRAFKYLDSVQQVPVGFDSLFLVKFCQIMGISPLIMDFKNIKNPTLNLQEGVFTEYNSRMSNNPNFVPTKESLEIYKLSNLELSEIADSILEPKTNTRVFNYLILYISAHLSDLSRLKSLKILQELVV
mgnify:CR=1 FL=1|tara:strand:+ start:1582 stop:2301 length:720 start_codon:yes stop_codon:yes gene_type:complete